MIIQIFKHSGQFLEFDAEGIQLDGVDLDLKLGPNGRYVVALEDVKELKIIP